MEGEVINSDLLELFNFWYGVKFIPTNKQRELNLMTKSMKYSQLRRQWDEVWFAKKEKQVIIDKALLQFEPLVELYIEYKPSKFYEKMTMIVLYDQVPRNVYRKTSQAYQYDEISRKICLSFLETDFDDLPLQFKFTILICLCHSENFEHQTKIRTIAYKFMENEELNKDYKEIFNVFLKISDNHYIRIENFGRIPERNQYVGRINTEEENMFLDNLK